MADASPEDILSALPGTELQAAYDPVRAEWTCALSGAWLRDGGGTRPLAAKGATADASVAALLAAVRALPPGSGVLTRSEGGAETAWTIKGYGWAASAPGTHAPAPEVDLQGCLKALRTLAAADRPDGFALDPATWQAAVAAAGAALPGMREAIVAQRAPGIAAMISMDYPAAMAVTILKQDVRGGMPEGAAALELARNARKGLGMHVSAEPAVDHALARAVLDALDDHRLGEGSPMSTAWRDFLASARDAAPGYEEDVRRYGPAIAPSDNTPEARGVRLIIEASVEAGRIPPEDVVDAICRIAREPASVSAAPSR